MRRGVPGRVPRVPTLRYVVVDVFTDTRARREPARGLHRRPRRSTPRSCRRSRSRSASPRSTFVLPAEAGRHRSDPHLQPATTRCRSPVIRCSGPRGCSPRRSSAASSSSRPGSGSFPSRSIATSRARSSSGAWRSRCPTVAPSTDREPLFGALGVRGLGAPRRAVRQRRDAHRRDARRDDAVAALAPDSAAIARFGVTGVNCIAGAGSALEEPHVLAARRGRGDRLGGRADRVPPLPARARRVGRVDRDLAGRRDRPTVDALRSRRRRRTAGSSACSAAVARCRRAGRVPALGRREERRDGRRRDAGGLDRLGACGALHDVRHGVRVSRTRRVDGPVDRDGRARARRGRASRPTRPASRA